MKIAASASPGITPAMNRSITDTCVIDAYTIIGIEGGIRMPRQPPPVSVPIVRRSE